MGAINYDLTKIKALLFDVDGVISKPVMQLLNGVPQRTLYVKDSYSIQLAVKKGLIIGIVSGGHSEEMYESLRRLGVYEIRMRAGNKSEHIENILSMYSLKSEEVLYMGDDIPDYHALQMVGLPCCPADADHEIKQICKYISERPGGMGCVRDVIEQVLRAQNLWMNEDAFHW